MLGSWLLTLLLLVFGLSMSCVRGSSGGRGAGAGGTRATAGGAPGEGVLDMVLHWITEQGTCKRCWREGR